MIRSFGERGYCCCSVIRTDGQAESREGGYITVKDAHSVTIISRTVKYEEDYRHEFADKVLDDVKQITDTYEEMLEANRAYLEPLMERSFINLDGDCAMAAEELLNEQHSEGELSPMLMEKLYDMGRFFLIKIPEMIRRLFSSIISIPIFRSAPET